MATGSTQEEQSGAFVTYLLTAFLGVLGALIGWAIYKGKGAFAKSQTTEALNWGISLFILNVVISIVSSVLAAMSPTLGMIGLLSLVLLLANLILSIMAAMKAKNGEAYRYPFAFRFIK